MIGAKSPPAKHLKRIPILFVFAWTAIGMLFTIASTFLQPNLVVGLNAELYPIATTLQVGAVLLTGCLGGRNAGLFSQILYVGLGLSGLPIFYNGGGMDYLQKPAIGFLVGFIPGAWLCGFLAFLKPPSIERLTFSCISGLVAIHLVGILTILAFNFTQLDIAYKLIWSYSFNFFPFQLVVISATVVFAKILRWILIY
jgi:biotin transport system substrate-specific component